MFHFVRRILLPEQTIFQNKSSYTDAVPDSVTSTSPPTFLLAANDDECCSEPVVRLLQMHRKSKVPVEVHLYAQGKHAFNMGNRSSLTTLKTWPQRLADWMKDTEYDWEWYTKMVGRMFNIHPAVQTAKLKVLDPKFPGLRDLDGKLWTDEWYDFSPEKTSGLNYILSVDESTYNAKVSWGAKKSDGMGQMHPIAWYHDYDGGRAFYTGLGHIPVIFSEQAFLAHLYAGILYAATGKK